MTGGISGIAVIVVSMTTKVHRVRISIFMRRFKKGNMILCGPEGFSINRFLVGLVVMMLLVMGGAEVNPEPPVDQQKSDPILELVKNQGLENQMRVHSQKTAGTTKGTNTLGQNLTL
jgi:hypothetical protein